MKSTRQEIKRWYDSVWDKNGDSWANRNQDFNYRRNLIREKVGSAVKKYSHLKDSNILDVGCGTGDETWDLAYNLYRENHERKVYGIDINSDSIRFAKEHNSRANKINRGIMKYIGGYGRKKLVDFDNLPLDCFLHKNNLRGKIDVLTSMFVLNEMSSIDKHIEDVSTALSLDGRGLFVFVHPDFANALQSKRALKVNYDLKSEGFDYCAEYPIVEEGGETFHVPYFHRSLERTLFTFDENDLVVEDVQELMPDEHLVQEAEQSQITPFCDHPGNIYYPEIIDMPSSVMLTVRKHVPYFPH